MRRRSHVLVFAFGAAAALLLSAPALSAPPPLAPEPELAVPPTPGIQHSPSIAIDPADPVRAVVAADDGNAAPPFASTTTGTTTNWSVSWNPGGALQYSGSASAGQPDVAWGVDDPSVMPTPEHNVYLVETGSSTAQSLCSTGAGILLSTSSDGGASYGTAIPVDTGGSAAPSTELVEPAIASAGHNVYIAYTELKWSGASCSGTPTSSSILMTSSNDDGGTWVAPRRVSPVATTGLYRSPSLTQLPDGRVIVAFRDDALANPQIETETCSPFAPATATYCGAGPGLVGPSTVIGDATAPAVVSGVVGPPTPSVIAAGGRVAVAWSASVDANVRAFAAMSTDNGVTYGPATQIDPNGAGNQVAPELAATAGGRVDAAYLWDSGLGGVSATTASANPPLAGAATEAWAQPVVVQGVPAASLTGIAGQAAPLGRRLGVAISAGPLSPLPATVVAYTDTTAGQDVHVTALLHGTTAPAIPVQTVRASKNATTIVTVAGSDDDGDPLTWSVGAQPSDPESSVSVYDSSRGQFSFRAANKVGLETFEAVGTDGVPGHETHATITVSVENDPPDIICSVLNAHEDEPLEVPVSTEAAAPSCVRDRNQDQVTVSLDTAIGGTVEHTTDGKWLFNPTPHSIATGSFVMRASDASSTTVGRIVVIISPPVGKVTLRVTGGLKTRTVTSGLAVRFGAQAIDAAGHKTTIFWNFGDGSPEVQGVAVAHRFRRAGAFKVKVTASNTSVTVPVVVRRRAVELVGVPQTAGGVMTLRVRTRAAGLLSLRVDSRSQTVAVPAGSRLRTLHMQVTTGPLVRLTLRLKPKKSAASLLAFSLRRLVLVPPLAAG
jgi:hypothetical protein